MELRQLRYLILVSEELSFTRAAARGNIAQPALSRQIQKLEDELGVPLVDRTSRRVRMTAAGSELVGRAQRVLTEIDDARAAARDTVQLLRGRITIGVTQTPGPFDVAGLLGAFHASHPGVELALREDLSVVLADLLRGDDLDLAFVSAIDGRARRQLALHPMSAEKLVLIVAPDHPLANRRRVGVRDLRDEPHVAFPTGATIREAFVAAARRAGFEPRISFESNHASRVRSLVAHGLGVAVLPDSDTRSPGPTVVAVPIHDRTLVHHVLLAWRAQRRLTPAAAELIRHVQTASSALSP